MKELVEKILERLEESSVCEDNRTCNYCQRNWCPLLMIERDEVEKIVNEVSEEYNDGWIPCSERLPEEDGMYLTTSKIYFTPDHVDEIDNYIGIKISCYSSRFGWDDEVFAWQPLPEPYQPKGD